MILRYTPRSFVFSASHHYINPSRYFTSTSSCTDQLPPSLPSKPSTEPAPPSPSPSPSTSTTPPPSSTSTNGFLPLPRSIPHVKGLFLLTLPIPPKNWPPKLELYSSWIGKLKARLKPYNIGLNTVYDGIGQGGMEELEDGEGKWDGRLFLGRGKGVGFEGVVLRSMDGLEGVLSGLGIEDVGLRGVATELEEGGGEGGAGGRMEILVCTHGSRDCRCSDRGVPLVEALREEVKRRGLVGKVAVSEVGHVGGHKYAANAILLPSLDMLSNLTTSHAPAILSHLLNGRPKDSPMWNHWRGRYGLTEAEQAEVWASVDASHFEAEAVESVPKLEEAKSVRLRFKTYDGEVKSVQAKIGSNLLDVARVNGLPSMEGVCGGHLECATCHLYLANKPSPPPVKPPGEEELDMLGYAIGYREGESRLGCQILVGEELGAWCESGGVLGLLRY